MDTDSTTNMTGEQTTKTQSRRSFFQSFRQRVLGTKSMNNKEKQDQIKAAEVLVTQGDAAFVKHVFTDQDTGKGLTYAEMRSRYG